MNIVVLGKVLPVHCLPEQYPAYHRLSAYLMKSVPVYLQFLICLSFYLYCNGLVWYFQASTMQVFHLSPLFFFCHSWACSEVPPSSNLPRLSCRTPCAAGRVVSISYWNNLFLLRFCQARHFKSYIKLTEFFGFCSSFNSCVWLIHFSCLLCQLTVYSPLTCFRPAVYSLGIFQISAFFLWAAVSSRGGITAHASSPITHFFLNSWP